MPNMRRLSECKAQLLEAAGYVIKRKTGTARILGSHTIPQVHHEEGLLVGALEEFSGNTVETPRIAETGCLGAALVAMDGTGAYPDCPAACAALKPPLDSYRPNPALADAYATKYRHYRELIAQLRAFNDTLHP